MAISIFFVGHVIKEGPDGPIEGPEASLMLLEFATNVRRCDGILPPHVGEWAEESAVLGDAFRRGRSIVEDAKLKFAISRKVRVR